MSLSRRCRLPVLAAAFFLCTTPASCSQAAADAAADPAAGAPAPSQTQHKDTDMSTQSPQSSTSQQAGEVLGKYYRMFVGLRNNAGVEELATPEDMAMAIKSWRDKGLKDGDLIESMDFDHHPKCKAYKIPFGEMEVILADYRPLYTRYRIHEDLRGAEGTLERIREGLDPRDPNLYEKLIEEYERGGDPALCKAALATAREVDPKMKVGRRWNMTIDQFEKQVCDELPKFVPQWVAAARAALRERNQKVTAPLVAAGLKGQKLDLIVAKGTGSWFLPGGAGANDAKQLAAASVLFLWLEAPHRINPLITVHTVRRYQFRGSDLEATAEKEHLTEKGKEPGDVFR